MANGKPRAEILKYVTAIAPASPSPPMSPTAGAANATTTRSRAPPSNKDSHNAWDPRRPAARS